MVQGYPEKVVEVQIDGAPEIGHEENPGLVISLNRYHKAEMITQFVFGLPFVLAMAYICPERI